MSDKHDVIWLEGVPVSDEEYGRQWCQDNVWVGEGEADKYLLATPPRQHAYELLTALKSCEAMVSTDDGPPNWDLIRAVIAKAEVLK